MTEKMTPEEIRLWDAKAEEEAWNHALEILGPMLEIAEMFGSPELIGLLKRAEEEGRREHGRAPGRAGEVGRTWNSLAAVRSARKPTTPVPARPRSS
jgi:hypothetical protein